MIFLPAGIKKKLVYVLIGSSKYQVTGSVLVGKYILDRSDKVFEVTYEAVPLLIKSHCILTVLLISAV